MCLYIHIDQTGFMKGRYIKDVRRVLKGNQLCARLKSLTLFYFAEKECDCVELLYLNELLVFMGAGSIY